MKSKKSENGLCGAALRTALGFFVICACFALISLILTAVLYNGNDPTADSALFSLISITLSAALGSLINSRIFAKSKLNFPLLSAVLFSAVFLVISILISDGKTGALFTAIIIFAPSLLAIVLANRKKDNRKRKFKRH